MSVEETKPPWANIAKILQQLGSRPSHLNSSDSASRCAEIKRIRTASSWRWRDGSCMRSSSMLTTCSGFLQSLVQALYRPPSTLLPARHVPFKITEVRIHLEYRAPKSRTRRSHV